MFSKQINLVNFKTNLLPLLNQKNSTCGFFIQLKNLILGPLAPKTPEHCFQTLASCKKSENFYEHLRRKTMDKRRNRQMNNQTERISQDHHSMYPLRLILKIYQSTWKSTVKVWNLTFHVINVQSKVFFFFTLSLIQRSAKGEGFY